jgi:hypothetical protein
MLSNNGRVPSHRPFDVADKGYTLHVAVAEVIRGLTNLISNLQYSISSNSVHKLLRHFVETWREKEQGWRYEQDHAEGKCAWWLSAISIETLNSIINMLDTRINYLVLKNLSVRQPDQLAMNLDSLFYPDYGLVAAGIRKRGLAIDFQRLQAHACGISLPGYERLHSVILFGPPGTGKTTLAEACAKSSNVPLVEVTPSDILLAGAEKVETRARYVFEGLSMLTKAIILFDEFDSILWHRDEGAILANVFQFLTPGMLPKLKNLNESAKRQQVAFILSTNMIGSLDDAAIRDGRFDERIGVYPPDSLSRLGRLYHELGESKTVDGHSIAIDTDRMHRMGKVIQESGGLAVNQLGKPGWFTRIEKNPAKGTPFSYILEDRGDLSWPSREKEFRKAKIPDEHSPEVSKREWSEWCWVSSLDDCIRNMDESTIGDRETDILSISKTIERWKIGYKKYEDEGHKLTDCSSWNTLCARIFQGAETNGVGKESV